jgi:hypothetical protein
MELTLLQKLCSIHSKDFKRDKQNKTLWTSVHCGPEEGKNLIQHGKTYQRRIEDLYQTGTTAAIKTVQRPEI